MTLGKGGGAPGEGAPGLAGLGSPVWHMHRDRQGQAGGVVSLSTKGWPGKGQRRSQVWLLGPGGRSKRDTTTHSSSSSKRSHPGLLKLDWEPTTSPLVLGPQPPARSWGRLWECQSKLSQGQDGWMEVRGPGESPGLVGTAGRGEGAHGRRVSMTLVSRHSWLRLRRGRGQRQECQAGRKGGWNWPRLPVAYETE